MSRNGDRLMTIARKLMWLTWHWIAPQRMSWMMSRPLKGSVPRCHLSLHLQTRGESPKPQTGSDITINRCILIFMLSSVMLLILSFVSNLIWLCFLSEYWTCTARPHLWPELPACPLWRPATFLPLHLLSRTIATIITQLPTCQVDMSLALKDTCQVCLKKNHMPVCMLKKLLISYHSFCPFWIWSNMFLVSWINWVSLKVSIFVAQNFPKFSFPWTAFTCSIMSW